MTEGELSREVAYFNSEMRRLELTNAYSYNEGLDWLVQHLGQSWISTNSSEVMGRVLKLCDDIQSYGAAIESAKADYALSRIVYETREKEKTGLF